MSWLDLHMHSNCSSDGEFSPEEIMRLCSEAGIKAAAIADHNTIKGLSRAAQTASDYDIHFIPAVELDCDLNGTNLHVIGYGIDYSPASVAIFDQIGNAIAQQEDEKIDLRIDLIKRLGIHIERDTVAKQVNGAPITVEAIIQTVFLDAQNPLLIPYFSGGNRCDNPYTNFYWDFCALNKPAHVSIDYISLNKALDIIHSLGGIAVLAHPGANIGRDDMILQKILEAGIDGIEAYSSYHNKVTTSFYRAQAQKHRLVTTTGSDFHGSMKPAIALGSTDCDSREIELYNRFLSALN